MSLDKAILHGKEHRRAYRGCRAWDMTCRNHGSCMYCLKSRTYRTQKEMERIRFGMKDADLKTQP